MDASSICTPAVVYFVISAVSIVLGLFHGFNIFSVLIKVAFVAAWTWFLNFLCSKGYAVISWFLVLLPFILMLGVFAIVYEVVKSGAGNTQGASMPSQQQQGQHH
jgi:hypothetical protein